MTTQTINSYIGVDVSKASLDVFVLPAGRYLQFKNNAQGWEKIAQKLLSTSPLVRHF